MYNLIDINKTLELNFGTFDGTSYSAGYSNTITVSLVDVNTGEVAELHNPQIFNITIDNGSYAEMTLIATGDSGYSIAWQVRIDFYAIPDICSALSFVDDSDKDDELPF